MSNVAASSVARERVEHDATRRPAPSGSAAARSGPDLTDITADARAHPSFAGHEQVLAVRDPSVGLDAIVAIHSTALGPSLGGCRRVDYASRHAALTDVLRLSRAMTYKAALAWLDLGGGKAVLFERAGPATEALFRSFGRAVEALGGRYITGEDAGTSVREMDWIGRETAHVIGTSALGDPSGMTALGVLAGMRAAARHRLGSDRLEGLTVAVQGLGHVGMSLSERLAAEGATLLVADIDATRVEVARSRFGAEVLEPGAIHEAPADIFAPCALGSAVNAQNVDGLTAAIVAGSANNQLDRAETADALARREILYAPDYVINAGGLIAAALSRKGHKAGDPAVASRVEAIGGTLDEIFLRAWEAGQSPAVLADRMAEERIARGPRELR